VSHDRKKVERLSRQDIAVLNDNVESTKKIVYFPGRSQKENPFLKRAFLDIPKRPR